MDACITCQQCHRRTKEGVAAPGTRVKMVVNSHMGARNLTQVL